ncbi:MAG: hypothetical protein ACI9WU_003509, partial [Myxococcota bacterium]
AVLKNEEMRRTKVEVLLVDPNAKPLHSCGM